MVKGMKETLKIWVENTNDAITKNFFFRDRKHCKRYEKSHMDAVLYYCEKNDLEPDSVSRLITKGLKEKIEANARDLNFLEKTATLPI